METVGIAASVVGVIVLLLILALIVISLPDIARYMRVRRM